MGEEAPSLEKLEVPGLEETRRGPTPSEDKLRGKEGRIERGVWEVIVRGM